MEVKVKDKFPRVRKHHTMACRSIDALLHAFFTLASIESEKEALRSDCHNSVETFLSTHWPGIWVSHRVGLDMVEKRHCSPSGIIANRNYVSGKI
jgi:hypothetical protein